MQPPRALAGLLYTLLAGSALHAAREECGGVPYSTLHPLAEHVPTLVVGPPGAAPDADTLHPLSLTLEDAGAWTTLPNGDRVWRLRLVRPGARWLLVIFERFQLSGDTTLHLYDDDRTNLLGAFTRADNRLDGRLEVRSLPGDAVTLEVHEPAWDRGTAELAPSGLLAGTTPLLAQASPKRRGTAAACHRDVACPEGRPWSLEARSIVKIEGIANCTGVLLNNTSGDGTPYVLTANHCGNLGFARFWFHWKRAECGVPGSEAGHVFVTRSIQVLADQVNDFQLVRLFETPPAEMNVVYAGWDRGGELPTGVTCLHHPAGGEMKISVDRDRITRQKQYWKIPGWEVGITERGSSGAPLFDASHRVIGQLKGGPATCRKPRGDLFGRLQVGWEQLRPFLDPGDLGVLHLDAMDKVGVAFSFHIEEVRSDSQMAGGFRLRVQGGGFSTSIRAFLDGARISGGRLRHISNSRMEIDLPDVVVGEHRLTLQEGPARREFAFDIRAPEVPAPQVPEEPTDAGA